MNDRPFDPSSVHPQVFRAKVTQVGTFTFTDVTFAYLGEFYGCRFPGLVHIESERANFGNRQKNRRR